jgi:hypothetical protein
MPTEEAGAQRKAGTWAKIENVRPYLETLSKSTFKTERSFQEVMDNPASLDNWMLILEGCARCIESRTDLSEDDYGEYGKEFDAALLREISDSLLEFHTSGPEVRKVVLEWLPGYREELKEIIRIYGT